MGIARQVRWIINLLDATQCAFTRNDKVQTAVTNEYPESQGTDAMHASSLVVMLDLILGLYAGACGPAVEWPSCCAQDSHNLVAIGSCIESFGTPVIFCQLLHRKDGVAFASGRPLVEQWDVAKIQL